MNRKIGILRGINVGGKRKSLMADLKSLCEERGLKNVTTYLQSAKLICNSDQPNSELETNLEKANNEKFRCDDPVIVRTEKELQSSISKNPFIAKDVDIYQLHLTFVKEKPNQEDIERILTFNYEPDKFKIVEKDIFIFCAGKYHESKLTNNFFEKQLEVGATTRNWKTVMKLSELSKN